jgi:hypothetical protein
VWNVFVVAHINALTGLLAPVELVIRAPVSLIQTVSTPPLGWLAVPVGMSWRCCDDREHDADAYGQCCNDLDLFASNRPGQLQCGPLVAGLVGARNNAGSATVAAGGKSPTRVTTMGVRHTSP